MVRLALFVEAMVVVTIIANIPITFTNAMMRYLTNHEANCDGLLLLARARGAMTGRPRRIFSAAC